jgi:hypothetical protein
MAGDIQSMAYSGVVALTVGSQYVPQRSLGVLCTVAGNANVQMADGSTLIVPVFVGWQTFPFACAGIISASTTATATYYNLV